MIIKLKGKLERDENGGFKVWLNGKRLSPKKSQKIYNHSPNGFNWGYSGSGPSQLALAILLEVTDKDTALKAYQDFKFNIIANLPMKESFEKEVDITQWVGGKKK